MTEIRRILRITEDPSKNPQGFVSQTNIVLSQIMDMFDQVYGLRGTPTFYADVDVGGHKLTNAAMADINTDVVVKSQLDVKIDTTTFEVHDHVDEGGVQINYLTLDNLPTTNFPINPTFADVTASRTIGVVYQNTATTLKVVQISITLSE